MISVIITAYNAEETIGRCLQALENQSIDKSLYEVIVVDDGSEDNTADIARGFNCKVVSQKQGGPAKARNSGVYQSTGDIILFTDSDCEPDKNWIEEMVKPFDNPEIIGVKGIYKTKQESTVARFIQIKWKKGIRNYSSRII